MTARLFSSSRPFLLAAALGLLTATSLSGCASAPADGKKPTATAPLPSASDPYGNKKLSVSTAQYAYDKNKNDPYTVAKYAKALRESGDLNRAKSVLDPFEKKKGMPTLVYTEAAAQSLEFGKFADAEGDARKALKADVANFRAHHILGIALDAQQKHEEAEKSLRKALELWQGDSVPVMNNLALNLAAQGYTDKALDILYKAKDKDPGRVEIERNIRIIRTLNEPANAYPGGPAAAKPKEDDKDGAKAIVTTSEPAPVKKEPEKKAPAKKEAAAPSKEKTKKD